MRSPLRQGVALVVLQLLLLAVACQPVQELRSNATLTFRESTAASEPVDPAGVDFGLIAEAIYHETNSRRVERGLEPLGHLTQLDSAACVHARAMVSEGFFAHRNPNGGGIATPADRVRRQGLEVGFVAENIGEVFLLDYRSGERIYVREVRGRTVFSEEPGGEPLARRTYLDVAEALLDGWMSSPGHRRNILAAEALYLGAGCELLIEEEPAIPMLSCVQLFFAPLG